MNRIAKATGDAAGLELTPDELALINRHTLRELSADEVFAFKVTLCDNRIDRDGERFTAAALEKLAALFLGKTGIFDHAPKASGQTARIYAAEVVLDAGQEGDEEPYAALAARAYMLRDNSTMAVIRSIEAGILKEVSVGCAVDRVSCSICGKDQKKEPCAHKKGAAYRGKRCHHLLENPTDAYEWSFVAVPAQRNAGVTKNMKPYGALRDAVAALHTAAGAVLELLETEEDPAAAPEDPDGEPDSEAKALLDGVEKLLRETERSTQK